MSRSKLTPEVRERIVQDLRAGNYLSVAARRAGLSPETVYGWCRQGRASESGEFFEFVQAVEAARAESEVRAVARLRRGMKSDWRAAIAFLERMFPSRWKTTKPRELKGKRKGGPRDRGEEPAYDESELARIAGILEAIGALPAPTETAPLPETEPVHPTPADD